MAEYPAQAVGNRQAQAQSLLGSGLVAVQAFEFLEDVLALVLRDARAAVPDFNAQAFTFTAHAQQHAAAGIAEGVGEEVLQYPAQQFLVAVEPQAAAAHAKVHVLLDGQGLELDLEGVEQLVQGEVRQARCDPAAFQARDVQQVGDQVFGRAQRAVQVLHQFAGIAGQVVLVAEGGGKQPRGIQRLHQVMADGSKETGFRLVGRFGMGLGFTERLVEQGQLASALGHALLQPFVGLLEGAFGFAEGGDVGKAHDETAARHRVADQLDHPAIGEQPFGFVRRALAHPGQALAHVQVGVAVAEQTALGVEADDVANRPADLDQALGVVEQLDVAVVPRHQLQGLVDHAEALADVLDGALQQGAVELQHLARLVGDSHHVLDLHLAAFNGRLDHGPGRGCPQHAGQQALGVDDPLGVGVLRGVEALALLEGEAGEALPRTVFANEARGQHQQVLQLHGEQRTAAAGRADFLADESAGLPVLGDAGAGNQRHTDEQGEVADQ